MCGEGWVERGFYLPEEGEVRVRANRASCNPSRLGLGWGLYLWRRVVSWPCGKAYCRGRMRVWIPSPPQRVIGPVAYYPLEGGGIMKEPPPSLIVAGLSRRENTEEVDALIMDDPVLLDINSIETLGWRISVLENLLRKKTPLQCGGETKCDDIGHNQKAKRACLPRF